MEEVFHYTRSPAWEELVGKTLPRDACVYVHVCLPVCVYVLRLDFKIKKPLKLTP